MQKGTAWSFGLGEFFDDLSGFLMTTDEEGQGVKGPHLDGERYGERLAAERLLWEGGAGSVEELEGYVKSGDPEVAWRARRLLRWIDLEITPETGQETVDLLESYLVAETASEREEIYQRLVKLRAYVPLFRLPRHVADETVAKVLAERVAGLAGQVARARILEGESEEALEVLERAKSAEGGELRWISLASALGKREEYWEGLSAKEKMLWARWNGDVELIRSVAPEGHEVLGTIRLLEGDPVEFLERQTRLRGVRQLRGQAVFAHWNGEDVSAVVEELVKTARKGGVEESSQALQVLAQLGRGEEALKVYARDFPEEAFWYLQRLERIEEAFEVFGLELGEAVPEEWVEEAIGLTEGKWDYLNRGCRRIVFLADYFLDRGEGESAHGLLKRLWRETQTEDWSDSLELLGFIARGWGPDSGLEGWPELGLELGRSLVSEDFPVRLFIEETVGHSDEIMTLWERLEAVAPESDEWERARWIYAMRGREVAVDERRLGEVLKELEADFKRLKSEVGWLSLAQTAESRGDMVLLKRCFEALVELDEENDSYQLGLAKILSSWGRFEEAAVMFKALCEVNEGNTGLLVKAAVALSEAGKEEEAQGYLSLVEQLALGDPNWLVILAREWEQLGQYERSFELQRRALLTVRVGYHWVDLLERVSKSARKAGRWDQAAACREVREVLRELETEPSLYLCFDGRAETEFSRGMLALERGDVAAGRKHLDLARRAAGRHGVFADWVFPALRNGGFHEEAEHQWAELEEGYRRALELYPNGHTALNTVAWVASRAACDLDEAKGWIDRALELAPDTSAYLDTKAEVYFAKGERGKALEWSERALANSRGEVELGQLRLQYLHFQNDQFPLPEREEEEEFIELDLENLDLNLDY
ncbi:MAG: hypothetical protein AAGC74_13615 [Verrucomicrobiota bacterium]